MSKVLMAGDNAPEFKLLGNDNKEHSLNDYKGKNIILYFYPKDNTPGCSIQADDFTTYRKDFEQKGYTVIGVSPDDYESHCEFSKKRNLEVLLLSDEDKKIAEAYGAVKEKKLGEGLSINRSTFIIDKDGKLVFAEYGVDYKGHAQRLLEII